MTVFIGYESAYEFWRRADDSRGSALCASRVRSSHRLRVVDAKGRATRPEIGDVLFRGLFDAPLHIMASSLETRSRCSDVICHVCPATYLKGSFVALEKDVVVVSPALSFLQMAESFPLETLVVAGMELCGRYAVSREGAISSRCPLTSASRLRRFVGQAEGMRGVKKARRALRFVMDDSASPMETSLALLLSMPHSLGGYGLPRPVMNLRIDAVAFDKCMVGHCAESRFFRGDLCWPQAKLCVEYDSDAYHTGADRIAHDSWRRTELHLAGFSVVTITRGQLYDVSSMDRVARLLAKQLGVRARRKDALFAERQRSLREALLGGNFRRQGHF